MFVDTKYAVPVESVSSPPAAYQQECLNRLSIVYASDCPPPPPPPLIFFFGLVVEEEDERYRVVFFQCTFCELAHVLYTPTVTVYGTMQFLLTRYCPLGWSS